MCTSHRNMLLPAAGPCLYRLVLLLLDMGILAHLMSAGQALLLPHGPEAVAVVTTTRNETRVRLLLGTPDTLFTRLATPTSGSQNQDLVRSPITRHELVAIDKDYEDNVFYVMDRKTRSITAILAFSGEGRSYVVYSGISHKATALSVDWVDDAVYWTDPAYDAIFRFKGNGNCRQDGCVTTVVSTGLDNPTGLVVSPHRRLLFWVDDGGRDWNSSKLERSDLSGDNRVLLFVGLSHPSGIALDHSSDRVYWLAQSGDTSLVESCDLEGRTRYRAAVLAGSRVKAVAAWQGMLVMADLLNNQVLFHTLRTNVTRRLWTASPTSLTVFAPPDLAPTPPSMAGVGDGTKDLVEEGFLLLASEQGGVSILEKTAATWKSRVPLRHILTHHSVTAMAADVSQAVLYFFDRREGAIMWLSLEFLRPGSDAAGSEPMARVLTRVPGSVGGLGVDWLGKAVYWTDTQLQRLAAVTLNGRHVRCLVCDHVTKPRDIVIHPKRGLVLWVDVDDNDPRIEKIRMDGRQRVTVVNGGHVYTRPRALAIDFKDDMLYWSDGSQLCRSHIDVHTATAGSCAATRQLTHPAVKSIEILHDFLVWTDFLGNVEVADKDEVMSSLDESTSGDSNSRRTAMAHAFSTDLLYFHPSRQPADTANRCSSSHGRRCQHFCLPAGQPHCACSIGYWSRANGSCVSGFVTDRFLLVTDPLLGGLYQRYVSLPDYYVTPVVELVQPSDVVFDGTTQMVYWADTGVGAISRAYLNGSFQEIMFAHRDVVAESLFLDHRRQLLYFIDATGHKVGLVSLPTMTFTVILDSPDTTYHDLTGHLTSGALYLSGIRLPDNDVSQPPAVNGHPETSGVIMRCHPTRRGLSDVLVGLDEPRGMVISGEALYWLDASSKTVSLLNLTTLTSSVVALLPEWSAPNQLTLLDNSLYWTDSASPYLSRVSVTGEGQVDELSGSALFHVKGITSYDSRVLAEETDLELVESSASPEVLTSFRPVHLAINDVVAQKGFCSVPSVPNGRVLNQKEGAYVRPGQVIEVECWPGYGLEGTQIRRFHSVCRHGTWNTRSACTWAMTYIINEARPGRQGHYVIFMSSSEFIVPEGVTYLDALAIGAGGGGMYACSQQFGNLTRAGDGGDSRVGRYLRAGGGQGGSVHEGGRGGFGTVYFGGQGQLSSSCLGGGAAGENDWSADCSLGSTTCPFCGAGGAPMGCSLCQHRTGGCRGPWAVPGQEVNADLYGGGATGWAGGGCGGGGGYSRMTIDVTPGEVIQVTVGSGGQPSVGRAGGGVVVLVWGGRLEHILPVPDTRSTACRNFTWSVGPMDAFDDDFNLVWCSGHPAREP